MKKSSSNQSRCNEDQHAKTKIHAKLATFVPCPRIEHEHAGVVREHQHSVPFALPAVPATLDLH